MNLKVGDSYKKDGLKFYAAHKMGNITVTVRDFYGSDSIAKKQLSNLKLSPEKMTLGRKNIRENAPYIKAGKGINDMPKFRNDTVFLVGSGGSLNKWLPHLKELKTHGTVIATNRALRAFTGIEDSLDYAFFCDAQCFLFAQDDWWEEFDHSKTNVIMSYTSHPTMRWSGFKNEYWFGYCTCNLEEFKAEEDKHGLDHEKTGELDVGFCSLYSQLHLCAKLGAKRVVLLGHDFSLVDYMFHFCERFSIAEHINDAPDFSPEIAPDINGNGILTLHYLVRTAKVIAFGCKFMKEAGVDVINATGEGILYTDWIRSKSLDRLLKEEFREAA